MRELQQSVQNVVSSPTSVASVSVATTATGVGAYLELLSPILGILATVAGITLSIMLAIKTYKEIKIKNLQIEEIEEHNGKD
jgi:hypothetical protein